MTIEQLDNFIQLTKDTARNHGVSSDELKAMHVYIDSQRETENIPYGYDQVVSVQWGVHDGGKFDGQSYLVIESS